MEKSNLKRWNRDDRRYILDPDNKNTLSKFSKENMKENMNEEL